MFASTASAAEWDTIRPGVTTQEAVRAHLGQATRVSSAKVEGYDTAEWIYEGANAPRGVTRMTVGFGLLTPQGYRADVVQFPGAGAIVAAVAQQPRAIGYSSFAHTNGLVRLVPLRAGADDAAVLPDTASVISGRYPLVRPLYLYFNRGADGRPDAETAAFLRFVLPHYVREGKSYLTVAIGCTGGRHRSVMVAEALKKSLADVKGVRLRVRHRDS